MTRTASASIAFLALATACASPDGYELGAHSAAITANGQSALDWANAWISEAKADPSRVAANVYTTSSPALERMGTGVSATNRTVCGTFVTRLLQKSVGFTASDFYNSFNKKMDSCEVGTVAGVQKGTNSPDAAQYHHKIANCGGTGPVKLAKRASISAVEIGDIIAVKYGNPADHNNASGHVMLVRGAPALDNSVTDGPEGSDRWLVEIIDSTQSPHGAGDWRALSAGQGLGHGTFVLYTDANGAIVASRWSAGDPVRYDTTVHPIVVGGLQ